MTEKIASLCSRLIYSDRHSREFAFYLKGLVPVFLRASFSDHLLESFCPAFVASRQYSDVFPSPVLVGKKRAKQHFSMRCLAGASYGYVADTDGGHLCFMYLADTAVIEEMSELESQPIWKEKNS